MAHLGLSGVLAFLLAFAAPVSPARIGNPARKLSSKDVAALERTLEAVTGKERKPWLLTGGKSSRGNFVVYAYVPEEQQTHNLRRSTKYLLSRPSAHGSWSVTLLDEKAGGNCVQVAMPGRSFDSITGDWDDNQPFEVFGDISDAELISIITFIRSYSPPPFSLSAPKIWPRIPHDGLIQQVSISADGNRGVSFLNSDGYSGISVGLKAEGDRWIITQFVNWVS